MKSENHFITRFIYPLMVIVIGAFLTFYLNKYLSGSSVENEQITTNSVPIENTKNKKPSNTKLPLKQNAEFVKRSDRNSIDISGVWKCRPANRPNSSTFNTMKIKQSGNKITVKGIGQDWSGKGEFEGDEGYYDWKFSNGNKGRTTIYIDSKGNLFGEVKGQITPWTYIGTR